MGHALRQLHKRDDRPRQEAYKTRYLKYIETQRLVVLRCAGRRPYILNCGLLLKLQSVTRLRDMWIDAKAFREHELHKLSFKQLYVIGGAAV
jgi:hypothetical protein